MASNHKRIVIALILFLSCVSALDTDWLVTPFKTPVTIKKAKQFDQTCLVMSNGLISRVFSISPNFATIDLFNHMTGVSTLRAIDSEANVTLRTWSGIEKEYSIGGLLDVDDRAFINGTAIKSFKSDPEAFQFVKYDIVNVTDRFSWKPMRHSMHTPWPPKGLGLVVTFAAPNFTTSGKPFPVAGMMAQVHYEMYEGIPVMSKWVTVKNNSPRMITVTGMTTEILAVTEEQLGYWSGLWEGDFVSITNKGMVQLSSEFSRPMQSTINCATDPNYNTKAQGGSCDILTSAFPTIVQELAPTDHFTSYQTAIIVHDSEDKERQGLALRKMFRTLTPQVTENPMYFHLTDINKSNFTFAIDQLAEMGWEMIFFSFGSGFDILDVSKNYTMYIRSLVDYANSKGIEVGGYTLMAASVNSGPDSDCIDPDTGEPEGNTCLATSYSQWYFDTVLEFVDKTGFTAIETDGPYEGAPCASEIHQYHTGLADSYWKQYTRNMDFYGLLKKRGIYINSPDPFYWRGTNKDGMGYNEMNWNLPRWEQLVLARQNIFDGTYIRTPSQGWMFVPLVEYHGGGDAATLEPLSEHLPEYEWFLASYFGSGVNAAWRGWRLYDTQETYALVKKYSTWAKKYRAILQSDIIHIKRPDGRSWDAMLHVQSDRSVCKEAGFLMIYNQTPHPQSLELKLQLYYTGLTDSVLIREQEDYPVMYNLARDYTVNLPIKMKPMSFTWFVLEPNDML